MPFTSASGMDHASPAKPMSPCDRLVEAVERLDVISSSATEVARRIAGPIVARDTEKAVAARSNEEPNTLFDALDRLADRVHRIATALDDANSTVLGRL